MNSVDGELLQALWREACRHIELEESIGSMAQRMAEHVAGADHLVVRQFDLPRAAVETVAAAACRLEAPPVSGRRTECQGAGVRDLLAWTRSGRVHRAAAPADGLAALLAPPGFSGHCVAAPLQAEGGVAGAALLLSRRAFTASDASLLAAAAEPIAAALGNTARVHELKRLRQALEADKEALLSRLQRHDVADAIVGAQSGLRDVMDQVQQVAATDVPVLIVGETGTGKEVVARALHTQSPRARAPIVRVNCGAIAPGLVDSELFGHERGSFTGAVTTRQGWFERADGGTLFLDEVGELSLDAQVRLLRILQDGTFERVGGHKPLAVDVRLVAATHRDLREMVGRGTFREDLWYRISVFPIRLPPLRERREDIAGLAAHFAWRAGTRLAGAPLTPTPEDIELLLAYHWPGNVRELAAVIERAAILGDRRRLRIAEALGSVVPAAIAAAPFDVGRERDVVTLDDAMRRHIERALEASRGRIEGPGGAADTLRINPHTLRARMRKLGIPWQRFRRDAAAVRV